MDELGHIAIPPAETALRVPGSGTAMPALALAAVVFAAVPLVMSQPAPLEDWPSHLARVEILASLLHGNTFWSPYYRLNTFLLPNVALDAGIAALHWFGLSIATAGTVFLLATYALFIFGGARLAAAFGAADPAKPPIIAMLFYNGALIGGFVNYMVGLGLAFCVLAVWIEARDRPVRRLAIAALGAVAVFFAHLIAAGFLLAAMGLFELHQLLHHRRFTVRILLRRASPAAAAVVLAALFVLSPTTADGPGGGGAVTYVGAPSPLGIAKGKLILLFHPILDGSRITGAVILLTGMALFLLLMLRYGRPRLPGVSCFVAVGLLLLVAVIPNGIGSGYGLDYRLVVPLACVLVCATTLAWDSPAAHRAAFGILLATSIARSGAFTADFREDRATYRAFETAAAQIPPDSVLQTGMGARWDAIPWSRFWAPPAEYLATEAAADRVFVPTVFAIASQHPLVLNSRFGSWNAFLFFNTPDDALRSRTRLQATCADWRALGHTGRVIMLLVYPSVASGALLPSDTVVVRGPGFVLVDGCGRTSSAR